MGGGLADTNVGFYSVLATASPGSGAAAAFALLAIGWAASWYMYKREGDPWDKTRLASAAGLASLLFLAASPALPWLTEVHTGVGCLLGGERDCLTVFNFDQWADIHGWHFASVAVRVGIVLSTLALLPAFIWCLVDPKSSVAQAAVILGASAAWLTLFVLAIYAKQALAWEQVRLTVGAQCALASTLSVVVAASLVARQSARAAQPALPAARLRQT